MKSFAHPLPLGLRELSGAASPACAGTVPASEAVTDIAGREELQALGNAQRKRERHAFYQHPRKWQWP